MTDKLRGDVLVTGGAGAIGSRLVGRLLSEDVYVTIIDDLSSGYAWLVPNDPRVTLVVEDVCRLGEARLKCARPTVFHLAAFFANQNSVDHPADDLHTNGLGTLSALLWSQQRDARRLVYASAGCSIAGHDVTGPIREDMPVSLHLSTPYQITKALGEFYCNYFEPAVETVRCRFFNSFGPGEVPGPYRNVIPKFIWCAIKHLPLTITGTGEETRDFIYVDDLVSGLFASAVAPGVSGEAFNLGTGKETRIIDLAEMIIRLCNSRSRVEFAARRPWDKSVTRQACVDKAAKRLNFQPRTGVEEGLAATVEWFYQNMPKIEAAVPARMVA